ncbi:hypothetical protein D9M71_744920 [compost metagenome]
MGDVEHHLACREFDAPNTGAEIDLQFGASVEFQFRTVRQAQLAALAQGCVQLVLEIELMVLPAEPAKPHGSNRDTCGQRLMEKTPARHRAHRISLAQHLETPTRNHVGGAPELGELIVFISVLGVLRQPGRQ